MSTDHDPVIRRVLCRLPRWLPVVAAIVAVLVALSGGGLGLDADQKWGEVRIITLVAGLAILLLASADRTLNAIDRRLIVGRKDHSADEAPAEEDGSAWLESRAPRVKWLAAGALMAGMITVYLGLATVFNWPRWPETTYRYDMQAQAFASGQAALLVQPSPALAELANPYDPELRGRIDVIGDLSYYDGRYFMYWGPVPAAFSALWLTAGGAPVSDAVIVFLSVSLAFIFSSLMVLHLQETYFPSAPLWLTLLSLLLVGVAHPMLWTLNSPSIYTAAISSAQAFFLAGLYFLISGLNRTGTPVWRTPACGASWALALGCRLSLLPAILALTLTAIAIYVHWRRQNPNWPALSRAVGLILPLALGLTLLGAFNLIRFGYPFETGFAYQMVSSDHTADLRRGLVFNLRYLLPNLLYYLATPIRLVSKAPFIRPWWGAFPPFESFLARFSLAGQHSVENAAGLLLISPAYLLSGLLLVTALSCQGGLSDHLDKLPRAAVSLTLRRTVVILLLAALALATPTLLYRLSTSRFLLEITPVFAILSALGALHLHQSSRGLPARRAAVNSLIVLTIALSVIIGFLLALNGAGSRFDDANPALYEFLSRLLSK